jgi:hypothetical protein
LNKNIQYIAVLINSTPEVVLLTTDRDKNLVYKPGITESTFASFERPLKTRAELKTPTPYRFVGDENPRCASKSSISR